MMGSLPNYDDWKLASPPEMEIDRGLEELEALAGQVAEVDGDAVHRQEVYEAIRRES